MVVTCVQMFTTRQEPIRETYTDIRHERRYGSLYSSEKWLDEKKRKKNTTSAIHTETNKESKIPSSTVLKLPELAYSGRVHQP